MQPSLRRRARALASFTLLAASAFAVTPLVAHAPVIQVATGMADAPARMVTEVVTDVRSANAHYLGFDTSKYPGDSAMVRWKQSGAPYDWVGYYLAAPCHKDLSWSGKRETLSGMGYGLAVVYVGQQSWPARRVTTRTAVRSRSGRIIRYRTSTRVVRGGGGDCSSNQLSSGRGVADAADAIATAAREGFASGTAIFLDLERMDIISPAMRAYYSAWTAAVLRDGTFRPGYYVHTDNAETVYDDVKLAFAREGHNESPPFWVAGSSSFDAAKSPTDVGHTFANVWQGVLDTHQTWDGVRLPIDVSVADAKSPSVLPAERGASE